MPPSSCSVDSRACLMLLSTAYLCLLLQVIHTTTASPSFRYNFCGTNTTEFSPNSTYQSNLNLLLSSLSSPNATLNSGYRNFTINSGSQDTSSPIYGNFLCRGDIGATSECGECVTTASSEIVRRCPRVRTAIIWYDECMLRYSNISFFSTMDEAPRVFLWNIGNITESSRFSELLADTMNEIATRAMVDQSTPEKFATKKVSFTGFQTLYSLVQCTPDLSSDDCNRCLHVAIGDLPRCCSGKQGGRVLLPSCNVRYEVYPFYNESLGAAPTPAPSLRPPPPGFVSTPTEKNNISSKTIIAIVAPIGVCALLFSLLYYIWCKKPKKKSKLVHQESGSEIATIESLQVDFATIKAATNNFSNDNKIGEGGFGVVYKGALPDGQEIAIKRLSKASRQGVEEFKNEVVLLAKLQHRNLVRLLGFCLEGEEKILVYEFVPNKSLDNFLFDPEKQGLLDWSKRYKIIGEIARGLLYLHADSRLRIVHRDLKASNILLDGGMNAKISDFGMARIFGADQTQGSTTNVVGTYGYMPPEYAIHGHFSVKSDVYSFGVLILEIVSGKKISYFDQGDCIEDLISYAWKLWRDGVPLELLDPTLRETYSRNEVLRCIHIGLLCVQEDVAARPTMESVVLVLGSLTVTLPLPQQPAFIPHSMTQPGSLAITDAESDQSKSKTMPCSVNEASITEPYPR
ncbi:cysteine-rich receptor-like protein kinase 25 [Malania oleifera]|uniref:cysteine-rich receptor-like protein kinase 25 n=1 Tax=Malania oleifera TaxID=397392 RepID=UPI0025AE5C66|nr:cysteine-rich receptor-like protein kinase 25 [Malania oleifera]